MKDTVSRFGVLPYMGCLSQSNPAEFNQSQSRKAMAESNKVVEEESSSSMVKIKKSWSSVAPSRSNITRVMDKLIRLTFRGFTQVFAYKDIEDIKTETEMEIGYPTDVKHVTHIGYDGLTITETDKNRDHFQLQPLETLSFPSVSLKQIELAMAAQTETTSKCS